MSIPPDPAGAPVTGDPVVDAALQLLTRADDDDVDAQIAAGERLEDDLTTRLTDLAPE